MWFTVRLLSADEASEWLGRISRTSLDRRVDAGLIRRGKEGGLVTYCRRSVVEYASSLEE